ncbi:MAG: RNA methyltransferase [Candidatus Brocadiae bacterium]|nr:RNA methyltransferase [Candidatus Brocadiia bacterium]
MEPRAITSATNPRLKQARKLHARRHRQQLGLFLAEGPRVVEAALDAGAPLDEVFCAATFLARGGTLAQRLVQSPVPVWRVPDRMLAALAETEHPQGVVAVARIPADAELPSAGAGLLAVALDGVSDPGNVGTVLRVARGAGADLVILGAGSCDPLNAKAVRASAGSVFAVPVRRTDSLATDLAALQSSGARIVCAAARAATVCWRADLTAPVVVVVGSEAHGVSAGVAAMADEAVAIPMPGGGESLNAGMAAAIVLYEVRRQRAAAGA